MDALGELGNLMWFYCNLAQALLELGRDDEAEEWLQRAETWPSEERLPQMLWRQARGKLLARRGELEEAERLAREAVALGAETDMLNAHGDALLDLAEVLALAGRDPRAELEEALTLYEQKGNLVMAERTRQARRAPLRWRSPSPRSIFPRRCGNSSTNSISRGTSYAAKRSRTSACSPAASAASSPPRPAERLDRLALSSSGMPITAAKATAGWRTRCPRSRPGRCDARRSR